MFLPLKGQPAACACLPVVVLDTNIVLDWLVFDQPDVAAVAHAITAGQVRWFASPAMRDELAAVLARGTLAAWQPDAERIWRCWERWAATIEPSPSPEGGRLCCTDPDDQKFIDLAWQLRPCTLLSRDRAVLRLARRAQAVGLDIQTGAVWAKRQSMIAAGNPDA